jgi:hypothetical protein
MFLILSGGCRTKRFPVDSLDGIITQTGIEFDKDISSDSKGSIRITAAEPTVIQLFEISDINVENARMHIAPDTAHS